MAKKMNLERKARIAGIAGVLIGYWMIFNANDVKGLIPGAMGTILLLWRFK